MATPQTAIETGRFNYIVTASSDGELWSYGPFTNHNDALVLQFQLAEQNPEIEYDTMLVLDPDTALS